MSPPRSRGASRWQGWPSPGTTNAGGLAQGQRGTRARRRVVAPPASGRDGSGTSRKRESWLYPPKRVVMHPHAAWLQDTLNLRSLHSRAEVRDRIDRDRVGDDLVAAIVRQ